MRDEVPPGSYDCHTHVFGPFDRYPLAPARAYTPGLADLDELRGHLDGLGVERVVLVAPSPYGTDNRRLLTALTELGPRARAVAVLDPETTRDRLEQLHRAGVRGIRVNLHSNPAPSHAAPERRRPPNAVPEALRAASALAAPLGWHLQVFAPASTLLAEADTLAALPVPLVIDHFALVAGPGRELSGICELLGQPHVWLKLSAPERATADPDDSHFTAVARALLAAAPTRTVWASDWPHTDGRNRADPHALEPFRPIDDQAALDRLWRWCGADRHTWRAVLHHNPTRLYDPTPS